MILNSHIAGVVGTLNGNASIAISSRSVPRSSVSVPPMAIRLVEAKNAVPFCRAAVTCESTMRTSRPSNCAIH